MKRIALLSLIALFIVSACDDDNDDVQPMNNELTLNIVGLSNLGSDWTYEGWIMVDDAPQTTGTFNVDDNGNLSKTSFELDENDLDRATAFILTIEPYPDNDPSPSPVHVLAGDFSGETASLNIDHNAALGTGFNDAEGQYILATPTTTETDDELSGIWFLSLVTGSPEAGLELPDLPDGWIYEGWVVIDGMPLSTGRFEEMDTADMSAPYSGNDASGPSFPGEDFIMNAPAGLSFPTNLSGAKAVISVEPDPDTGPEPFAIKPLAADIPMSAMDHETYLMSHTNNFPTGTAEK
ncbi:MAG: hypothetical protein ACLFPE_14115 [Bacteroidales bacterium]